ncbi:hypothetical protein ACFXIQ_001079 [Vibrio vulnificus]
MKLIKLYQSDSYLEIEKKLTKNTPYAKSLSQLLIDKAIQGKEFGAAEYKEFPDINRKLVD